MNRKMIIKGFLMAMGLAVLCVLVWIGSARNASTRKGLGKSFEADFEKYMDVDPALIKYKEKDSLEPGLKDVSALAVGPGGIYVGGSGSVVLLDAAGSELSRIRIEGVPTGLAADEQGNLFVGLGNHVEVFDAKGSRKAVWEAPAVNSLLTSIVLRGGDLLVGDARKGQVLRYDRDGELLDSITGLILFSSPSLGMTLDSEGRLWVANPGARELRRYSESGRIEVRWNRPGRDIENFCGCCNPVDIAMLPDGNIVTAEKDIVRVKVMSPEGDLVCVVAGPREFDQSIDALEVEVDSSGRVLVLDPVMKKVRVFVSE